MRFSNISVGKRIQVLTAISLLSFAGVIAISLHQLRTELQKDVATKTQQMVETTESIVAHYYAGIAKGTYPRKKPKNSPSLRSLPHGMTARSISSSSTSKYV